MNSAGKRTVVVLTPSFFYLFNLFFVICHTFAPNDVSANLKLYGNQEQDNC